MSDPFAVRMNFKRAYLDKLTSSPSTQTRAAAYALKYREQDEDLHSCILETLDAVSTIIVLERWKSTDANQCNINLRANIMYFIEHLCDLAKREGHQEYIDNIERDLPKIIDLVVPGTKAGAMNIQVVRNVRHLLVWLQCLEQAELFCNRYCIRSKIRPSCRPISYNIYSPPFQIANAWPSHQ